MLENPTPRESEEFVQQDKGSDHLRLHSDRRFDHSQCQGSVEQELSDVTRRRLDTGQLLRDAGTQVGSHHQ